HFLDRRTADVFREGGTFHILVISGLHVKMIGAFLLLIIRRLTRNRWLHFAAPTIILWAFSMAVGGELPVVRATVLFTVVAFGQFIYREGSLLNSLGFSALILLAWRPQDLFSPSFQLTFVSVGAIVAFAFPLIEKLRAIGEWMPSAATPFPPNVSPFLVRLCEALYWRDGAWQVERSRQTWTAGIFKSTKVSETVRQLLAFVFGGIAISLVVQLWLLPLSVWYFHRVSLLSVLLNLWVGAAIFLESMAAVAALIAFQFSEVLAFPFARIAELFNWLLLSFPGVIATTDIGSLRPAVYTGDLGAIYIIYFIPVLILVALVTRWDPFALRQGKWPRGLAVSQIAIGFAVAAVIVFNPFTAPRPDNRLSVHFLDVGQGDAAVIVFPNGQTMLVDAGGRVSFDDDATFEPDIPRIGETVVSEFLWENGYSRVDYLAATHTDADHMQGLADVAANFEIGETFFARHAIGDKDFDELTSVLRRRNISSRLLASGEAFEIAGVKIEVLHPQSGLSANLVSANNNSLVLRLTFGEREFLLTGDIEKAAEAHLVASYINLEADVVKVPHHGSRTSSTDAFVNVVKSKYAVVSVGKRSQFGHPHPEIVDRWRRSGAEVLQTGTCGTITASTDGRDLQLATFRTECFSE
ncbi:MAG: competence protein ComEC family protein, partial [Acidobacteria bacterium]|nr:competence protein ComEC family protein [Acidobacteriota bacterium]